MTRIRSHCNSCKQPTWHAVVGAAESSREDALFGEVQRCAAETLQCCGCDLYSFRLTTHPFSFQDENDKPEIEYFPERNYKKRQRKFFSQMPASVRTLYHETVAAHESKLVLLPAVGLRALLEAIIVDRVDESKYGFNLESKINSLAGIVDDKVLKTLHDFRTVGNEAVHAQISPDHLDIHRALFVVESLMEYFYGLADGSENYQEYKSKPKVKRRPKNAA